MELVDSAPVVVWSEWSQREAQAWLSSCASTVQLLQSVRNSDPPG